MPQNSPTGLLSLAGCRPLLPKGLSSDPSWAHPLLPRESLTYPPPHTHTHRPSSGNSGASCCLGCRAKNLPLGSHPQRPRVDIQAQRLPTRLDNCYFSEGEGRRQVEVEGEEKRAWEAGTAGIMVLWFLSQCLSPATRDIPTLQPRPCTVRAGIPGHVSTLGCLLTKCMTLP